MKSIKTLFVAAVAAGVLTVFPAIASASGGFVADQYPATLTAPSGSIVMNVSGTATCTGLPLSASLAGPSSSVAAAATAGASCIQMNGCKFELRPGTSTFDIGPAGCGPVTSGYCETMKISAQTGLAATYENTGSGSSASVVFRPAVSNVEYTTTKWTLGCGAAGTRKDLSLNGYWQMSGSKGGTQVGIHAVSSGDLPVGVFMDAGGSDNQFDAQAFPVTVKGQRDPKGELMLFNGNGQAKCESVLLNGGELSKATTSLSLGAEYAGCTMFGELASVKMNSCKYVLSVKEGLGSPVTGWSQINCTNKGDAIEVASSHCSIKIGPQELGPVNYAKEGSGSSSTVQAAASASAVQITKEGSLCFLFKAQGSSNLGFKLTGVR